eukprot:TRINITY_DN19795_c0_g1_i1.p1 TRINITY_DN19795_c0_g1~~TRINITY_DN19795_c0_g1_i1.p1  ORF type:complete len:367 (+),score=127.77 TRINITY_DN19795_c0_g1_i1:106-1101(+)
MASRTTFGSGDDLLTMHAGFGSGVVVTAHENGIVHVAAPAEPGKQAPQVVVRMGKGPAFAAYDEHDAAVWWASAESGAVLRMPLQERGPEGLVVPRQVGTAKDSILAACFNDHHGLFITADRGGWITYWRCKQGEVSAWKQFQPPGEAEPWHLVDSVGDHVIACRHNPEVYVFDSTGTLLETRVLGNEQHNYRQIRALACAKRDFFVAFNDGSVQVVPIADRAPDNSFTAAQRSVPGERVVVHRGVDCQGRCAVADMVIVPGTQSIITAGTDGLYRVDVQERKVFSALRGVDVRGLAATEDGLALLTAAGDLVRIPWETFTRGQQHGPEAP